MIDGFLSFSATFLHASIEFALACVIVVFALIAVNLAVCRVNNSVIHYRQIARRLDCKPWEVKETVDNALFFMSKIWRY